MNTIIIIIICLTLARITDTSWFWSSSEEEKEEQKKSSDKVEVKEDLGIVIGIDLGTTYTSVAVFKSCHFEVIENDQGNRITPSYVTFTSNGERLIGDAAKNLLPSNPQNTIFQMKRLIGRTYDDPSVQQDIKHFPFSVLRKNNKPVVKVKTAFGDKLFTPEEISAMILGKMREMAETYLGEEVKYAIVSVPAYFNNAQRQATKDAGTIAGLNVIHIINEPTAAAIAAYGLDKLRTETSEKKILVYDLGGGTFDVTLLNFYKGVFDVEATNGDTHLGGEDFDLRVMEHFIKLFKEKTGKDIREDPRALQKLRQEVEKAKRILSTEIETKIEIESLVHNEDFSATLTRSTFESLNMDLFRSTLKHVQQVLEDADGKINDVDEIILVGGSTRIPMIRQIIKEYFNGKEPLDNINPDEIVAYGAAMYGAFRANEECVKYFVVLDVNPLTVGIETEGGVMSKMIPRNSMLPTGKSNIFTTTIDNQNTVSIQVFEGERSATKDNYFLGEFELTGIPPAPKGTPIIQVRFVIDNNGTLEVTAEEKGTGNKKIVVINSNTNRLSPEEIDRMINDAEKFADQDKKFRYQIDARNELESYVYLLKTQLTEKKLFESLPFEEKMIENAVEEQIKLLEYNPDAKINQLRKQKKQLEDIVTPIINKLFKESDDPKKTAPPSLESDGDL